MMFISPLKEIDKALKMYLNGKISLKTYEKIAETYKMRAE